MTNHLLCTIIAADVAPSASVIEDILRTTDTVELHATFTSAPAPSWGRVWAPGADAAHALASNNLSWIAERARIADVVRILCVIRAASLAFSPAPLVGRWYESGSDRERVAILRSLSLLPRPQSYLPIALRGARSSREPVFRAVCLDNPYPAAFFPDAAFEAMVDDAVARHLLLARVIGLVDRERAQLAVARSAGRSLGGLASFAGREIMPESSQ